jgi:lipopolysaccharide transport system ATP-binding protein
MTEPTIELEGLRKVYRLGRPVPSLLPWRARQALRDRKEVVAIEGLDLRIDRGTVLGVIGSNGSGKSTLLKILARVSPPTAGRATVRGRVVSMLELGAAFQADATGRENVYLNAALNGIPRAVVRRRMDDIIQFAELEEFIDTPVSRYSSGMYLRLAFSVAVNMEPHVLLADEILAVGDIGFQERCLQRIEADGEKGLTVFFVSHDMAAVRRLCSRVIWLDRGRLMADGEADDVTTAYENAVRSGAVQFGYEQDACEAGALLETRLVNADGRASNTIRTDEEAFIEANVRTDRSGMTALPGVSVNAHGMVAFRTGLDQTLEFPEPGTYRIRIRIPPRLLAETTYDVKFGLRLVDGDDTWVITRKRAVVITVADSGERLARSEKGDAGLVRPRLDWSVDQLVGSGH